MSIGMTMFIHVIRMRWQYVRLGMPSTVLDNVSGRVWQALLKTMTQGKLWKDWRSGLMHLFLFYGFLHLQIGAVDIIWKGLTGNHLPLPGYEAFVIAQEYTVMIVLAAILYAGYRRYVERLARLKRGMKPAWVLLFIVLLMVSVVGTMVFDRALEGATEVTGSLTAWIASSIVHSPLFILTIGYEISWWLHLVVLLVFLVYVPQSKHFHLIVAPINLGLQRSSHEIGKLEPLDLEQEEAESFGVGAIEQFRQNQLVDLYACVECGRCTNVCPAASTGKWLSPMHLITKLRDHLTEKGAAVTSTTPWVPALHAGVMTHRWINMGSNESEVLVQLTDAHPVAGIEQSGADVLQRAAGKSAAPISYTLSIQKQQWVGERSHIKSTENAHDARSLELIGDVMSEQELWACTTCRNCEDQCPVGNEHVDKIIDMRRYLVLTRGELPADAQRAMTNIERQGNPWGINRNDRHQWALDWERSSGRHVPVVKESTAYDVLLLVGSMGAYDRRSQRVIRSLIRLMEAAGIRYAVLGNEERSSGDTARRLGNEFLYQELARDNVALFKKYDVKQIVTACPHTYHTIKKEYPDFGLSADIEVYHHTEWLWKMWQEGRIQLKHAVNEKVVWHDSCYLARYNDIVDAPRELVRAIPQLSLVEMERHGKDAMCCGAGGGRMWMEETEGKRVNVTRVEQALLTEPTVIGSACPYCLTMMEDGTKSLERDEIRSYDIAELVAMSVLGERE
ncbi:(Fe-S)-binding protein [Paenibacillus sp. UMB4589-SE434]|uniref:heterodisulfide reductase-related iron-sulfur binding cluster n=1 Tax=Paenibacillus sp. UMB4589-SE434 TaxID=3046314 RepID=UPI00254EAA1F|nr:(Fe-S)-binding protein [Paenibacillus sp. UMB4589-SE434]